MLHKAARPKWKMPWALAAIGFVMLLGSLLMLYPSTASWFSQYNQSQIIESTSSRTKTEPLTWLQNELERAREYNELLGVGESLIGPESNVPTNTGFPSDGGYADLLKATDDGVMARLRIPAITVELPIYHGTSDAVLGKGVGHLEGTSLPVGGVSQRSVLTAHRGLPSAELFNNLHKMELGDTFTIEVFGETLTYQAVELQTILPSESQVLLPEPDRDLVTLITCTPLGINTHRYLVTGERITPTPIADLDRSGSPPEIPGFPWWALGVAGALGLYTVAIVRGGRARQRAVAGR